MVSRRANREPDVPVTGTEFEQRGPGRPRDASVEQAILGTTIELIIEGGLDAATIHAVTQRSGVARATIYLRWPNRAALLRAALRQAIGRPPYALSGNIEADLRQGAQQVRAILSEPLFVAMLPVLIPKFIRGGDDENALPYDTLFPGRVKIADQYREHAAAQGWRSANLVRQVAASSAR